VKGKQTNKRKKMHLIKTKILQKTLLILIPGFAALLATTANAQNLVALQGDLHQSVLVSQTCNGGVCNSVFQGSGTVNIMGPMTWTVNVTQDFNGYPCNTAVITEGTFVGATGSITIATPCGTVCPSATHSGAPSTLEGLWNVTGGTGAFSGIIGSGTIQGTNTGNGPNVHLSGIVVY
jgi:hypothetical protein